MSEPVLFEARDDGIAVITLNPYVDDTWEWDNPDLAAMLPFEEDSRNVSELGDHNATAQRIFDRVGWQ